MSLLRASLAVNSTLMHGGSKKFLSGITKSASHILCQLARHAISHAWLLGCRSCE